MTFVYKQSDYTAKTIMGAILDLEILTGVQRMNNTQATLNAKYNVHPTVVPAALPKAQYFGVGIGGSRNISNGNLTRPNMVKTSNMDMYTPLPIRCVPIEEDLLPSERANYRMRVPMNIGGQIWIAYYLKLISFNDSQVTLSQIIGGVEQPYALDYANLNPTAPTPDINGLQTDPSRAINVDVSITLPVTGAEIGEGVGALYGGDPAYLRLTEWALYTGVDQTLQGTNASNVSFTYTEAALATMYIHHTNNGIDLTLPQTSGGYDLKLSRGDLLAI